MRLPQRIYYSVSLWALGFVFCVTAFGQIEPFPDTLDWRGYYPLEVGNSWEWSTDILVAYHAKEVVEIREDTIINDQHYFIEWRYKLEIDELNDLFNISEHTRFLRYDTVNTRVVGWNSSTLQEFDVTCDLSAEFDGMAECSRGDSVYTSGYYTPTEPVTVGTDEVPSAATKSYFNLGGGEVFYHGVGRLPGIPEGASGTMEFQYVRLGSQEYGQSYSITNTNPIDGKGANPSIYPNPARHYVRLDFNTIDPHRKVEVIDILGRMVGTIECPQQHCETSIHDLAAGLYLARIKSYHYNPRALSFVVKR